MRIDCRIDGEFCGKCCYETEMPLSKSDIERITSLGYNESEFAVEVNGVKQLRNVDGRCFFLEDNICTIYPYRPEGCRIYPFIYDEERDRIIVDEICPKKDEIERSISHEEIKKIFNRLIRLIKEIYG
ncbi:putative Fe-S-cluster oxidoreductase [Archaeoglobus sulfaticallidus PM70-1]|uniref:Putative Fe-S-cluster oxidoreductase n=1 Tax=Archaeoglobus sulfaticallidus PM70-1 TaxID=387631 RepID=N0BL02_9EURY|nr:YkgJ family cysteine cluster protein [Archaeoglobus sulfaticallidus]AGK61211.1 putative Fe-S-cluster oxidoreductase [Archaeoglobus sulfaticallidus PM70-1]